MLHTKLVLVIYIQGARRFTAHPLYADRTPRGERKVLLKSGVVERTTNWRVITTVMSQSFVTDNQKSTSHAELHAVVCEMVEEILRSVRRVQHYRVCQELSDALSDSADPKGDPRDIIGTSFGDSRCPGRVVALTVSLSANRSILDLSRNANARCFLPSFLSHDATTLISSSRINLESEPRATNFSTNLSVRVIERKDEASEKFPLPWLDRSVLLVINKSAIMIERLPNRVQSAHEKEKKKEWKRRSSVGSAKGLWVKYEPRVWSYQSPVRVKIYW